MAPKKDPKKAPDIEPIASKKKNSKKAADPVAEEAVAEEAVAEEAVAEEPGTQPASKKKSGKRPSKKAAALHGAEDDGEEIVHPEQGREVAPAASGPRVCDLAYLRLRRNKKTQAGNPRKKRSDERPPQTRASKLDFTLCNMISGMRTMIKILDPEASQEGEMPQLSDTLVAIFREIEIGNKVVVDTYAGEVLSAESSEEPGNENDGDDDDEGSHHDSASSSGDN